jgi:hypothetical protein
MRGLGRVVVIMGAALACGPGCGVRDQLGFTPVEGHVTLDGRPVEGGEIRFQPDTDRGTTGPLSASPLGRDGRYSLRGPGTRIGALPGEHRVYLVMPEPIMASEPMILIDGRFVRPDGESPPSPGGRPRVPARFLAPETSGMTATVAPATRNTIDFELVSQKP